MTHKHDVYFSPYSTEAHNLVMQIADYCNKRGIWYKISESTLGIGIEYGGNVAYVIDADRKTEPSSSETPNNCEHITEDGVTCAKYPACDDCLDNPLNKVKGSERLVKGSEQTEPTCSKMEQVDKDINVRSKTEPKAQMKTQNSNSTFEKDECAKEYEELGLKELKELIKADRKDEPQTYVINPQEPTNDEKCFECDDFFTCDGQCDEIEDEPQTDCPWK